MQNHDFDEKMDIILGIRALASLMGSHLLEMLAHIIPSLAKMLDTPLLRVRLTHCHQLAYKL